MVGALQVAAALLYSRTGRASGLTRPAFGDPPVGAEAAVAALCRVSRLSGAPCRLGKQALAATRYVCGGLDDGLVKLSPPRVAFLM
ncbi:hypothetical protein MRX96_029249 [Rhipicephalus microplus]